MKFFTNLKLFVSKLNEPVSKFLACFLLLFSLSSAIKAQDINTVLQVTPPYSASLKDYANVTNARFTGFISCITCNNVELTPKRIKLRLIISKENTVIAYSNDIVSGETVMTLQNGATLTLGLELNNYFKFENLQGISADNYNHLLADGSYTINFQVLDYLTSAKIGSLSTSISITTNDAPVLIAPRNGENIQVTTITTIPFSWSAPISQSGFQTNYEYALVEIVDELGDIKQQFLNTTPIYTTTKNVPTDTIDAALKQLKPAKTYAWRVHAIANNGTVPLSLFKNDGYSEIFAFKYNGACAIPTGLQVQARAADQINVSWSPSTVHYQFRVAYRKYSTTLNNQWVEQTTANNFLNLTALEPNTTYEIKLGGVCGTNLVSYTAPLQATTLAAGVVNGVVCGQQPTIGTLSQTPLATLFINDSILAGDFRVTITRVSGSNGNFTGEGWIKVPWLADTKIAVKFTNITVNSDKKLTNGFIVTAYDPEWSNVVSVGNVVKQVKDVIQTLYDLILTSIDKDYGEITKMIDQMRQTLENELPTDLKNRLEQALIDLENAKKAYDIAKQQYNDATTDADRAAAKAAMNLAEQNFKDAQARLDAINKEKDNFINDVINILIKSIKDIRTTKYTDAKITALKTDLDAKELAFRTALNQMQSAILPTGQTTATANTDNSGSILLSVEEVPIETLGQFDARKNFKLAEREYNRALLIKAFASETNKVESYKLITNYLKASTESYVAMITRKKNEGATEAVLIGETKELLSVFMESFLNRELK